MPLYSPPPRELKVGRFGTFESGWTSDLKGLPPHLLPKMKSQQIWNLSSQVGLQILNCCFTPPPPPMKWPVARFGTFKSSWNSDFKVPFHPLPLLKMKSSQIGNLSSQVGPQISDCYFQPPPPSPIGKGKLADLEI